MNLTKPDKSIFASSFGNLVKRPRLVSGYRPKPKEKLRSRQERQEACGGQYDGGEVLTLSLRQQHGKPAEGIRGLFGVADLVAHWDYCLECCSSRIQAFQERRGKKMGSVCVFFQKMSDSTAQDFAIETMDQKRAYGSGLTGPCILVTEGDLDNYA